jgi:polyisoprenoid-binding protein YceI
VPTYRIVPDRSTAWIEADSSVHPIHGEANGLEGTVEAEVNDGAVTLGGALHLELGVDKLSSGNKLYDGEMQRRVQARRYPRIVGEAKTVTPTDEPGRYRVEGDLTFHGVTRTVQNDVRATAPDERTVVIEGEHTFDVREYGIEPPKILMLRVHPDVKVRIRVVAEREG